MYKCIKKQLSIILFCVVFLPLFSCQGQLGDHPESEGKNTQQPPGPDAPSGEEGDEDVGMKEASPPPPPPRAEEGPKKSTRPLPTPPGAMKRGAPPPPPSQKKPSAPSAPRAGKPAADSSGGVSGEALKSASTKLKKPPPKPVRIARVVTEEEIRDLNQQYRFSQDWHAVAKNLEKDMGVAILRQDEREQEVLRARLNYVHEKIKKEEEAEAEDWEP